MTVSTALAAWSRLLEADGYRDVQPRVLVVTQGPNPLPVLLIDAALSDAEAEQVLVAALAVLRKGGA